MPTLSFYPTQVLSAFAFSASELSKVLGNTSTEATHTGSIGTYAGLGGKFRIDMSALPASAIVSGLRAQVLARASATNIRAFYSFEIYNGGSILKTNQSPVPTSLSQWTASVTASELAARGINTAALRGSGLEWANSFLSLGTSYATLYWQKFWVDVDYTLPAGVPNPLFFNELF